MPMAGEPSGQRSEGAETDRVSLEAELRSRIRQQEALAQLGERALTERDLERLLSDAVSTVAVTLSVDFVKILELLPGNIDLLLRAGFGWNSACLGKVIASTAPGSLAHYTLGSAPPVIIEDLPRRRGSASMLTCTITPASPASM